MDDAVIMVKFLCLFALSSDLFLLLLLALRLALHLQLLGPSDLGTGQRGGWGHLDLILILDANHEGRDVDQLLSHTTKYCAGYTGYVFGK